MRQQQRKTAGGAPGGAAPPASLAALDEVSRPQLFVVARRDATAAAPAPEPPAPRGHCQVLDEELISLDELSAKIAHALRARTVLGVVKVADGGACVRSRSAGLRQHACTSGEHRR